MDRTARGVDLGYLGHADMTAVHHLPVRSDHVSREDGSTYNFREKRIERDEILLPHQSHRQIGRQRALQAARHPRSREPASDNYEILQHGTTPQCVVAETGAIRLAWPSGSRAITADRHPRLSSGNRTDSDSTSTRSPRSSLSTAGDEECMLICQYHRSSARVSTGSVRPLRGARYSRNSTPGPAPARRLVMRRCAPKTLFRCSCSAP